jgi:hypothetical protein
MNQNQPRSLVFFRLLAVAHGIVGLIPLFLSVWFGGLVFGRVRVMPEHGVSMGWFMALALALLLPLAFGVWMLVLAFRLWRPVPRLAGQLFWTHLIVLLFGGFHCVLGIHAIRAAQRSTAAGGGLLSPLAFFPFLVGVPLVALALVSLVAASRLKRAR